MGVPAENTFVLDNGDVLELTSAGGKVVGKAPAGDIVANGPVTGELDSNMLRDRRLLSRDGLIVVSVVLSPGTGALQGEPEIVSKGFVDLDGNGELLRGARVAVVEAVGRAHQTGGKRSTVEAHVREALSRYLYEKTHRRPVIIPVVMGI